MTDTRVFKETFFDCEDDLSVYADSLLFTDDEVVASYEAENENGNKIEIRLIVTGDVDVTYGGERYRNPDDFPEEMRDVIKRGEYDKLEIENNNWFEVVFTLFEANSEEELAYDGDVFEDDLSKMTPDELKKYFDEYAETVADRYLR